MTEKHRELRDLILPVMEAYVTRISLFGSVARGDDGPDSDIDVLVKLKPAADRPPLGLRWFELEEELSNRIGRPVEMVTEDALSPHFRPYVEEEAVVLYEEE